MTEALNEFKAGMAGECNPSTMPMDAEALQAIYTKKREDAVAIYNRRAVGFVALTVGDCDVALGALQR
jgi:hypothetical protein